MILDDLASRQGKKKYPEASSRYVDRVLATESNERILAEEFEATPDNFGGGHVLRPAGEMVNPEDVWKIREAVLTSLEQEGLHLGKPLRDNEKTLWDRVVGAALLDVINMEPMQLFGEDAWTYLTVHLLPEFAGWRFPGRKSQTSGTDEKVKPRDRVLGGRRNVLFRVWFRAEVLGPDLRAVAGADPLGEDELDNIFGRSTISRNREFTRKIVDAIYRNRPQSKNDTNRRNQVVREFLKEIKRKYSTVQFMSLGDELDQELDNLWVQAEVAAKEKQD